MVTAMQLAPTSPSPSFVRRHATLFWTLAALASVVAAIDSLLPSLPDPVFQAAVATRTSLIDALLAQDLKPATYRDVTAPMPAIVLAYLLGVDEAVFLARNAVRHPLFVRGRVYG